MSDESQGPGWWLASDGKWYPPELASTPPGPAYTPPVGPSPAEAGAALSYGWGKYTKNVGPLLLIILLPIVVQVALQLIGGRILTGFGGALALSVITNVIGLMASIGIFNAGLTLTAGGRLEVGAAFSSDQWGQWIVFAFVWGLMVGVGALLCGVGALVVIAIWGLAPFYVIDQRMSLGDALSASSRTTAAIPGLRVALALTALAGVVGILACGIGILVTMPTAYIGAAYLYRIANNQPVAA